MLRIRLIGRLEVEVGGEPVALPTGQPSSLLAWLALHPGAHPRASLAERFWPGAPEPSARAGLRTALWSLRRALGAAAAAGLVARGEAVELAGEPAVWVDVRSAEVLAAGGRAEEAAHLLDGDLLPGLDDDWVGEERERTRATRAGLLERLAAAAEDEGDLAAAARHALRRAEVDPLSEAAHRDVVRLLAAAGDRAAGLREHRRFVARLRTELGLAPSEETRRLVRRVTVEGTRERTFPPRLERHEQAPFVGREPELARLRAVWAHAAARNGPPALALLAGEPGIGKTRLAARIARLAHAEGAAVAYGTATEDGLVPVQPFAESLGDELGVSVDAAVGSTPAHRLFASTGDALRGLAGGAPLLFVLDDLQWADETSLALLKYVLRSLESVRGLVLATYRPVAPDSALARALGDVLRDVRVERVEIEGLTEREVARLVRSRRAKLEPQQLHDRSGGNPLFVELLLRQYEEGGRDATVPASVQEVVALRLQGLGAECRRILVLAAVLGEVFTLELLARLAGRDAAELADTLEGACRAGVVVEEPAERLAYRFAHALLRESLYGALTRARRTALHHGAATALDELGADEADLLELARHRLEAVPLGSVDDALPAVDRASAWAEARGAWEQAVELYGRALAILPAEDSRRRQLGVARAIAYQALTHAIVDAASAPVLSRPG